MDEVKLSEQDLLYIEKWRQNIVDKGGLENDLKMLLWDGAESLKNNLFFSSISVFTIFLEKYLRDKLIWCEFIQTRGNIDKELFFEYLEKIEEKIEDGKDQNKDKYAFHIICDKLVQYGKIEESTSLQLKAIYKNIRIPVQHGIYGRLVREHIGKYTVPVNKIEIPENPTIEELKLILENSIHAPMNDSMNIHNPMLRLLIIPRFFKNSSLNLLKAISELINIIEDKNSF